MRAEIYKGAYNPPSIQLVDLAFDKPLHMPFGLCGQFEHMQGKMVASDREHPALDLTFDSTTHNLTKFFTWVNEHMMNVAKACVPEWFQEESEAKLHELPIGSCRCLSKPSKKALAAGQQMDCSCRLMHMWFNLHGNGPDTDTLVYCITKDAHSNQAMRTTINHDKIFVLMVPNVHMLPVVSMTSLWFVNKGKWGMSLDVCDIVMFPVKSCLCGQFIGTTTTTTPVLSAEPDKPHIDPVPPNPVMSALSPPQAPNAQLPPSVTSGNVLQAGSNQHTYLLANK